MRGGGGDALYLSVSPSLASPQASTKHPQALVQLQGVRWMSLVNLTFAASTQSLLTATGVEGVVVDRSVFQGAGAGCVTLDGNSSVFRDSLVEHCGGSALVLRGGNWNAFDPATLFVSANQTVASSEFADWARWERTPNSPGIDWSGVGHRVIGNVLRDAPEPAVVGNGNVDCTLEGNLITNVNYEQSDMGAYCECTVGQRHAAPFAHVSERHWL